MNFVAPPYFETLHHVPQSEMNVPPSFCIKKYLDTYVFSYGFLNRSVDFLYTPEKALMEVFLGKDVLIDEVLPIIYSSLMGCVLRINGTMALHGTTMIKNGLSITICGESGAGKSTLSAHMLRNGYSLVCDDLSVLDLSTEIPYIHRSLPTIRLNEDTKQYVYPEICEKFWDAKGNKVLKDYWLAPRFCPSEMVQSDIILYLDSLNNEIEEVLCKEIYSSSKVMTLMKNRYAKYLSNPNILKTDFEKIQKMQDIPLIQITQPKNFEALDQSLNILEKNLFPKYTL